MVWNTGLKSTDRIGEIGILLRVSFVYLFLSSLKRILFLTKRTFFYYFSSKTIDVKKDFQLDEGVDILSHSEYNPAYTTTLYIHGYNETQANESIEVIVKSYLQRGDHNVILLDWSLLADGNYFLDAVPNCKQVCFKKKKDVLKI